MHFLRRHAALSSGIFLVFLLALVTSGALFFYGSGEKEKQKIVVVSKQSFQLRVTERGVVRPARVLSIKSMISGSQSKLVWMIDEGEAITKGQIVARFDTKPFMDNLEKAEQHLTDARAQFIAATKSIELQKEDENSKLEAAKRELEIATIQANDLKNGAGPLKRQQFEQKVRQAKRAYDLAANELDDLRPLLDKGHVTLREFEKGEDSRISSEEALEIARAELVNFGKYEWPRILREAEVIEDAARVNLSRVLRTTQITLQKFASEVEKARRDQITKEKLLRKAQKDVAACDIYSPADGILLYAFIPAMNSRRKIQIGDSVWVGQTFLEVPDTRELVVEINVREIDVAKLKTGMKAEIELDAFPGHIFPGELMAIDALARKEEGESVRRFFSRIKLLELSSGIHVGMSANVKIIYKELNEVPAIPPSCIVYSDGKPMVKKAVGDGYNLIDVKLGGSGIQWVQVEEGLNEGDYIVIESL